MLSSRYCFGSSGFPNVLMLTVHTTPHPSRHLRPSSSPSPIRRIAALVVATVALYPAFLLASEATPPIAPTAELAVLDRNEVPYALQPGGPVTTQAPDVVAPPAEIRIKLHGIEDLSAPEKKQAAEDRAINEPQAARSADADELKKQAQAKYLAEKLKKHERAVRKYVDLAWAEASKRELDPELLIAIIKKESSFRPQVQSPYGAQGLMQVVRRWHRDKLHPSESLFDPEVNIRVGADVLEEYLELAGGNLNTALRKYSGNARGYVNTVLKETRTLALLGERAATEAQVASRTRRKG